MVIGAPCPAVALVTSVHRPTVVSVWSGAFACVMLLAACSAPAPEPSLGPVPSGSAPASELLAPNPPLAVQAALGSAGITFVPLTENQLATVRVTRDEAEPTALASRGFGYGSDGELVVWEEVGCVFLGMYTAPAMPTHGDPYVPNPFPAYLVQVLADPIPDFPKMNFGVVVVDATSGQLKTQFGGGGRPPDGLMGTTCGVEP